MRIVFVRENCKTSQKPYLGEMSLNASDTCTSSDVCGLLLFLHFFFYYYYYFCLYWRFCNFTYCKIKDSETNKVLWCTLYTAKLFEAETRKLWDLMPVMVMKFLREKGCLKNGMISSPSDLRNTSYIMNYVWCE